MGVPSGHVPGLIDSFVSVPCALAHTNDSDIVIWTSGRPSVGHLPGWSRMIDVLLRQVQTLSRRMPSSSIPHLRHTPGLSSMTSSSPAIGQTYETGGKGDVEGFWA